MPNEIDSLPARAACLRLVGYRVADGESACSYCEKALAEGSTAYKYQGRVYCGLNCAEQEDPDWLLSKVMDRHSDL
ncbi:MAG: hypothetical protein ACREAC_05710 [Blastocatellia bacterium]